MQIKRLSLTDLGLKQEVYRRTGVREYWIVEPDTKTLKVYQLAENAATPAATLGAADTLAPVLLPGLTLTLSAVLAA